MLVLTSRYGEETALRALRYFASFAFNVSFFLERIPCAKLAKYRKARGVGCSKEDRPYRSALNRYRNLCYKQLDRRFNPHVRASFVLDPKAFAVLD